MRTFVGTSAAALEFVFAFVIWPVVWFPVSGAGMKASDWEK